MPGSFLEKRREDERNDSSINIRSKGWIFVGAMKRHNWDLGMLGVKGKR